MQDFRRIPFQQRMITQDLLARGDNPWFDNGTSQRFIADLADLNQSMAVNSTGQSGHLLHAHRDDQIAPWRNGDYHPVLFDRRSLEKASEGMLTLTPY